MRDFHLMLFVLVLIIIDVTFITIWVYYDPLDTKEIIFDELVRRTMRYCTWSGSSFTAQYKSL